LNHHVSDSVYKKWIENHENDIVYGQVTTHWKACETAVLLRAISSKIISRNKNLEAILKNAENHI
jgi:hypothetical protein